jgi:hypothetical protein
MIITHLMPSLIAKTITNPANPRNLLFDPRWFTAPGIEGLRPSFPDTRQESVVSEKSSVDDSAGNFCVRCSSEPGAALVSSDEAEEISPPQGSSATCSSDVGISTACYIAVLTCSSEFGTSAVCAIAVPTCTSGVCAVGSHTATTSRAEVTGCSCVTVLEKLRKPRC